MRLTLCVAACAMLCAGTLAAQGTIEENGTSRPVVRSRACASPKIEMIDAQLAAGMPSADMPKDYFRHLDDAVFFYFSPVAWRTPRFAEAQFTLHRDGSVSGTRFVTPSGMADFDSALTAAIASASSERAFGPVPASVSQDTLVVTLYAGRHAGGGDKPYLEKRTTCPAWPSSSNPIPEYPIDMKQQNVRGFVRVQFMVNEDGRPDPNTLQILQTSGDSFTQSVRAVLASLHYEPASVQGTKVKQLTEQTFTFGFVNNMPTP